MGIQVKDKHKYGSSDIPIQPQTKLPYTHSRNYAEGLNVITAQGYVLTRHKEGAKHRKNEVSCLFFATTRHEFDTF